MANRGFVEFCDALVGTWAGLRDGAGLQGEHVESVWEKTLGGSFLHEEWFTSGKAGVLAHTATAYFRVATGEPGTPETSRTR